MLLSLFIIHKYIFNPTFWRLKFHMNCPTSNLSRTFLSLFPQLLSSPFSKGGEKYQGFNIPFSSPPPTAKSIHEFYSHEIEFDFPKPFESLRIKEEVHGSRNLQNTIDGLRACCFFLSIVTTRMHRYQLLNGIGQSDSNSKKL